MDSLASEPVTADVATLGHRIRHFRTQRGLTLDELGTAAGVAASQLSLIENGKREPRISLLGTLASALGVQLADLLSAEPPDERAALEIELSRAQRGTLYGSLGLPAVKPTKGTPTETLEALVGLHRELARRATEAIATPARSCGSGCAGRTTTSPTSSGSPRSACAPPDTSAARSPTAR